MFTRKRIVIALGGNALGNTLPEQMVAVKTTAKALCDLIEKVIRLLLYMETGHRLA